MNIVDLLPADTPEYMIPAWVGCIHWAISNPDLVATFRADTGNQWIPATDVIGKMVDQATGADQEFVRAFVVWVNENVWGPMNGGEGATG